MTVEEKKVVLGAQISMINQLIHLMLNQISTKLYPNSCKVLLKFSETREAKVHVSLSRFVHERQQLLLRVQSYTIFPARENTLGVKNNGTWNGVIRAIANLEADIGLLPLTVSREQYEAIEFCGLRGDNTGILVKYTTANNSFTGAFDIWIGGITSGIGISALSVILSDLTKRLRIRSGR
ncbi:hypothetical protein DAPPUDRAFT_265129 [Daphnia pulex]|uniref:Ionotropic glutamate receptor L-glutamate and glycine-binding domain-containing protein n=1 Tax=Daphnia pulex TaxID=6669 RepID=E9HSX5_DAPPU|nr:hypothetical protein DAPPUDRAFT_265129 [Daphnia pulex]|eukprot:EFX65146.1 hypothetical protein DAPPUDRAFT_265129 [Daphnia pulex]